MTDATTADKLRPEQLTYEQKNLKYKIAGWLYFPLQYLVMRWLTMGFSLTPTLEDMFRGFNIAGLLSVVQDFASNITGVLQAEHIAFILFNLFPYAVRLAWEGIPIMAFVYAAYTGIVFLMAQMSIIGHAQAHINDDAYVLVRQGAPGSGKSSSAGYDAIILAARKWRELKYKYWLMSKQVSQYIQEGDLQKLLEWYEVRDSYEYYITRDCIPCLWSNIPMQVRGQRTSVVTYEHAAQIKRLPAYSVLFFDEIGSIFRISMSVDKPLTVSDFFRLCRHFGEYKILSTEQDASNIFNDVRRVSSENRLMIQQKWVNKPWLFLLPYNLIKSYFASNVDRGSRALSVFMQKYNTLIKHIGQRRYTYINKQSTQEQQQYKSRERKKTMYLPTVLNYQYDDRTFKNLYLAKNREIEAEIFDSLLIEDSAKNTKRYLKADDPNKYEITDEDDKKAA